MLDAAAHAVCLLAPPAPCAKQRSMQHFWACFSQGEEEPNSRKLTQTHAYEARCISADW
jgi:hypothetical protein